MVDAKDAAKHPIMRRMAPRTKHYPATSVVPRRSPIRRYRCRFEGSALGQVAGQERLRLLGTEVSSWEGGVCDPSAYRLDGPKGEEEDLRTSRD